MKSPHDMQLGGAIAINKNIFLLSQTILYKAKAFSTSQGKETAYQNSYTSVLPLIYMRAFSSQGIIKANFTLIKVALIKVVFCLEDETRRLIIV